MKIICPECKNEIDQSNDAEIAPGETLECPFCGINLMLKTVGANCEVEIVEEGK